MNLTALLRDTPEGATLPVRVSPRASRTAIIGILGEGTNAAVKISLAAPPVDGKANEELITYLARTFSLARAQVEVIAGSHSKNKIVRLHGKTARELIPALEQFL